jgi:hypothetical protein
MSGVAFAFTFRRSVVLHWPFFLFPYVFAISSDVWDRTVSVLILGYYTNHETTGSVDLSKIVSVKPQF